MSGLTKRTDVARPGDPPPLERPSIYAPSGTYDCQNCGARGQVGACLYCQILPTGHTLAQVREKPAPTSVG